MINRLSNRVFAFIIIALVLIAALITVLLILRDSIAAIGLYLEVAIGLLTLLIIVLAFYYVVSKANHARQMRLLERQRIATEIKEREEAALRERERLALQRFEAENKHQVELAHAHAKMLEARAKLEDVRLRANIEDSRVLVPQGHTVVFADSDRRTPREYAVIHGMSPNARVEAAKEQAQIVAANPSLTLPYPEPLDFAQVLGRWMPTPSGIYVLATQEGDRTIPMGETCHIGLTGPTGGGKTNVFRMLLGQFLYCDAHVLLCNPNYAPVKLNQGTIEDWRPIAARLAQPPAWQMNDIQNILMGAKKLLDKRKAAQQINPVRGKDVYIALGEWPAIVNRWKDAPEYLSPLLREARQYGIYVISEFQDALVKTIGGDSGVRECYRTGYYFGGDMTTAKAILDLPKGATLDEAGLGMMGASYFRWYSQPAVRGRVPFFSNNALYTLLGEPENALPDKLPAGADAREFFRSRGFPEAVAYEAEFFGSSGSASNRAKTVVAGTITPQKERTTGELEATVNQLTAPTEVTTATAKGSGESEGPTLGPNDLEMNEIQAAQFCALYPVIGNIEKSLRHIDSGKGDGSKLGQRYYTHARILIRQYNLTRKNGR